MANLYRTLPYIEEYEHDLPATVVNCIFVKVTTYLVTKIAQKYSSSNL